MTEFYFKVKYIIIDFFLSQTMLLFLLLVTGHVKKWSPSISSASAYPNLFVNHSAVRIRKKAQGWLLKVYFIFRDRHLQ